MDIKYCQFGKKMPCSYVNSWILLLQAGSDEITIELKVVYFSLENMPGTDSVAIHDGPDSTYKQLRRFYGYIPPKTVVNSTRSWLNIVFMSDGALEQTGFNFTYRIQSKLLPYNRLVKIKESFRLSHSMKSALYILKLTM